MTTGPSAAGRANETAVPPAFTWDHSVAYVDDLHAAQRALAGQGITAAYGGRHVGHGTENALAYFGLNYLELLALDDPREAQAESEERGLVFRDAARRLPEHPGLSRIALRVRGIESAYDHLQGKGLRLGEIVDGNRTTASGQQIRWKLLAILGDDHGLPYPFVIDWLASDDDRFAGLERDGLLGRHKIGDVRTRRAVFEVPDPAAVAAHWSDLFGFARASAGLDALDDRAVLDAGGGRELAFVRGPLNGFREIQYSAPPGKAFDIAVGQARFTSLA